MSPVLIPTPDLQLQMFILGGFVITLWAIEIFDQLLLQGRLDQLGIYPRNRRGLRGILFAPLLHGTWSHLISNTAPFAILGWLVMLRGLDEFWIVTAIVWVVSGLGVWLLGPSRSLHIGASGIIFGYFGFLLSRSYFEQNWISALFSATVALVYGPIIWGILPSRRGISWQGHLFGFVGGILAARYLPEIKRWLWSMLAIVPS